jgi:hypothetical protein
MIDYSISVKSSKPGTKKADVKETKAYGQAQIRKKLTLEEFAAHIREHGCVYDKGDIAAIITKTIRCLREQLLLGLQQQPVRRVVLAEDLPEQRRRGL